MTRLPYLFAAAAALSVTAAAIPAHGQTVARAISADGDLNLTSYTNAYDPAGGGTAFSSAGDGFAIYQRGVSSSIPFAVLDDSTTFTSDVLGIINSGDTAPFFGLTDTVNNDAAGTVEAVFTFDTSSASGPLQFSFDIAAMGDFETDDLLDFEISIDGGTYQSLASLVYHNTGPGDGMERPEYEYTLESGTTVLYHDPISLDGTAATVIDDNFATIISGPFSGDSVSFRTSAALNGSDEAVVFRNLSVSVVPEPTSLAVLGLGGLGLLRRRRA